MSFGGPKLLDGVTVQIEEGQRVCIVGRNGEGKSTLLRLFSGDLVPDAGEIIRSGRVSVARLSQKVPEELTGTVYEVVAGGLGRLGRVLGGYHEAALRGDTDAMAALEDDLERFGGWEALPTVDTAISHLRLDPEARFETLSGGRKRRALLARALAGSPDVLLLDEPTNHLDIDSIAWLEEFLLRRVKTLVFITHDRMFLRRIATRILELDRGNLTDWSCGYDEFLTRRDEQLAVEEKQWAEFDKKLAKEEAWIRQGIKARRTRNEGRVRDLKALREERRQRRERVGTTEMVIREAGRTGKMVVEAKGMRHGFDGKPVIGVPEGAPETDAGGRTLDLTIMRGDRIGLVGPNGAGKTTLLNILLGRLKPDEGSVRLGTNLEIAYFDQHREELDPDALVRDCIADGNDMIALDGGARHVMGYLKDFLFGPDRAMTPVRLLSGGERARLLLARLFVRPSNVLVMDEPTNDLDAETLELLEERLDGYPGTVLVVSHDRAFLNNVVTSTIAFEGDGRVAEYVGGYDDWRRQRPQPEEASRKKGAKSAASAAVPASGAAVSGTSKKRKKSFKEQHEARELTAELAALPARIERLEADIAACNQRLSDPGLYKGPADAVAAEQERLAGLEAEQVQAFARWEFVEGRLAELAELA